MRIIPALDIINGQCVRLTKGDYSTKKIYNENPVEIAKAFEDAGIQHIHIVDLDGAKTNHVVNYKVLERIATSTKLKIDFGGGIKSDEDLRIVFESGAHQITGGSIAVKDPKKFENWITKYGSDRIILGADCHNNKIAISGWLEDSTLEVVPFIEGYQLKGIDYVICTDISKDGMLQGPSFDLYKAIIKIMPSLNLIASGGISKIEDFERLKEIGCEGAIVGKAIYEQKVTLSEIEKLIVNKSL